MLKRLFIVVLCTLSINAFSEELTTEKKKIIDELLEITGASKIGEMMGTAVANQMINAMNKQQQEVDPKMVDVIKDEVSKIMHDEFIGNGWLNDISYKIYHKYLTTAELKELLGFYKTPTGSKVVNVLPKIIQEGMLAGQKHGMSLGPVIQQRLMDRFKKEGFNK